MKRIKTLRVRFGIWTSSLFLAILTVFGVYIYFSLKRGLSDAIDNSLIINASQVAAGLNINNGILTMPDSLMEDPENADLRGRGFTIRILTPQGIPLQELGSYRNLPLYLDQSFTTYTATGSNSIVRIYNQPVYDNNQSVAIVQVVQSLDEMQDTLKRLLVILLISVPILVTIAGFSGYFLAGRALVPIDQITLTARRISAEDLSARLNIPATDDEVGRLAQTLNDMLARLDNSFQRERQFTNDASHELRTPLTAMQTILGMIREKRRSPEEYEHALEDLNEVADRLRTLVESLMHLARGEKQNSYPLEEVNLSILLNDVADSLRPLAKSKNLTLDCITSKDLIVMGDSDELIRLFVNLLDNAIKYTERGKVSISTSLGENNVVIKVIDTGIGISSEHIPYIFDRFYRAEESRTNRGVGLGLAIAKEIVHAHNGQIEVYNTMQPGTVFQVNLPRKI